MSLSGFLAAKTRQSTYSLADMARPAKSKRNVEVSVAETPSPLKNYPSQIYEIHKTPTKQAEVHSPAFTSPEIVIYRYQKPDELSHALFSRPQRNNIMRDGKLSIKKMNNWQTAYAIVSNEPHSATRTFQIYTTEQVNHVEYTLIEVTMGGKRTNDIPLYTFRIAFNNYEIICGCSDEQESQAWIDAMNSVSEVAVRPTAMIRSTTPDPSKFSKQMTMQALSDLIDTRCTVLEKQIESALSQSSTLGISTGKKIDQTHTLIDSHAIQIKAIAKDMLATQLSHFKPHDQDPAHPSECIAHIQETVDFISKSTCKLVDLFTDKFKGMRSPQKVTHDENNLLEKIDESKVQAASQYKDVKSSIDALASTLASKTDSTAAVITAKHLKSLQESIETLTGRLSTHTHPNPRASAPTSPEKQNSNLLISMNDKLVRISTHVEDQHDTQKERLASIEEKIRMLLTRSNDTKYSATDSGDGKEMRVLGEVKSGIVELEQRMTRASKDQKSANEDLQASMTKLSQTTQMKRSSATGSDSDHVAKLAQIESMLGAIQERLLTRTMRKSTSSSEIAAKNMDQKLDAIQREIGALRQVQGTQVPLSMNDGILKVMRGERVVKQDDPMSTNAMLATLIETMKTDKIERQELKLLVTQSLVENKAMQGTISEIRAFIALKQ